MLIADKLAAEDLNRLREYLSYDPDSGEFRWIKQRYRSRAGDRAGCVNKAIGYVVIGFFGGTYYAHRLAWLFAKGYPPAHTIDHIDGCRSNNAIANLRDVPSAINVQNVHGARAHNKSGVLGVQLRADLKNKKWRAFLTLNKKRISLGYFSTKEEAHAAYLAAKRQYHDGNTL